MDERCEGTGALVVTSIGFLFTVVVVIIPDYAFNRGSRVLDCILLHLA